MTKRRRSFKKEDVATAITGALFSYLLVDKLDKSTQYDPYTGLIIGTGGSVVSTVGIVTGFIEPKFGSLLLGSCAGVLMQSAINLRNSARIFRNDFGGTVYVLAENIKGKVYKLHPFSTDTPYGIDGLAIPSFRKDAVFKVPNGVKVVITREGNIKVLGPVAKVVTKVNNGGWVSKFDAQRRGWLNDGHWSELFKVLDQA